MGLIALVATAAFAASGSLVQLSPDSVMSRLRISDRGETSGILRDIFLHEGGGPSVSADTINSFVYSRFEAFSGPCFSTEDAFCPDRHGFYESAGKHSVVRNGYVIQACGKLSAEPEGVRRALSEAKLKPSDELSAGNILKAFGIFYPGRKVEARQLGQTIKLMAKVQRSQGPEKAWQKYLALVCSSVGWQIY